MATLNDREVAFLRASQIGFVFQQFLLAEHKSLLDNVADGQLYAGVRMAERKQKAQKALEAVGILALFSALHERGATIVLITHDAGIARQMPRRIEMLDGRVVADVRSEGARTLAASRSAVQPAERS